MPSELVTTSQPEGSLKRWKAKADQEGLTLSAWIGNQLDKACGHDHKRPRVGRPASAKGAGDNESV